MKKGLINISVIIMISIVVILTLLAFAQNLVKFSNYYRFYSFWQGYYLADSFEVKFFSNNLNGELVIKNVPFYSSGVSQEIGKAKLVDSYIYGYTKINQTDSYYFSKLKIDYNNGKIINYEIFGKYAE